MGKGSVRRDNVLVIGATSEIGSALCHYLAQDGCRLVLAGRNREELDLICRDLRIRYSAETSWEPFDALDLESHPSLIQRCFVRLGGHINGVVICHGYLPDQKQAQYDFAIARRTIDVNFTSVVSLLTPIANWMENHKAGWIAVISSVAGDRGRQSNYLYGSAKGALSIYLQGLRGRLFRHGVNVLTVKPGFVDTAMVRGRLNTNSPLVATPDRVAADIYRAIRRARDEVYSPWFWRPIMLIIRHMPEGIIKRLKL